MLIQAALVALAATLAAAVEPLEVRGQYFVNPKTGNRFQIVGVDYQPGGSAGYKPEAGKDPLSDGATCMRDVALMQVLGVNAMRVYNLDPNLNHDECASILNAAGIYMALDVNSPLVGESINSGAPWESYYLEYVNRTFAMVEAFKDYPNTLLFFAGNEVISNVATGATVPPYMRAVIRDLRAYVAKHASRPIPVGYSAADVREVLFDRWNYMQCGGPGLDDSRADIFGLNSYSWCGDATFKSSTYEQLVAGFTGTSVPIFFSEYGCNEVQPRLFTEVAALYSPEMSGVFSGGLVYEFSQEDNNYGIVKINADGSARLMNDFKVLMQQYAKLDFKGIQGSSLPSAATPKPPVCSKKLISSDGFNNNFTVPAMPPGVAGVLEKGVSPKPSGKLVTIKDFTVKQKVLDSNGNEIKGLAVVPVKDNGVNSPGVNSLEIAGGSGGGSNGNQPKKDAAPSTRASFLLLAGAMALTWLV